MDTPIFAALMRETGINLNACRDAHDQRVKQLLRKHRSRLLGWASRIHFTAQAIENYGRRNGSAV